MKVLPVLLLLAATVLYAQAQTVTCGAKTTSKSVTVEDGGSYTFKTQKGKKYKGNTKCTVKYKMGDTCAKMKFVCSKFNTNNKNKKCSKGDKVTVTANGKSKSYCKKKKPKVTSSGDMTVKFTSDAKKHSTGAVCKVTCTEAASAATTTTTTTGPTAPAFNPDMTEYMTWDQTPDSGPEMTTVYQPGTPGEDWTEAEVQSTRLRLLQAIHKDWDVKKEMFGTGYDKCDNCTRGFVSENALLRLAFHDCVRYTDGTGGCDGCLNHTNVGAPHPNPNEAADVFAFKPLNDTDNNGLTAIVEVLELIYLNVDWPFQEAALNASLYQLGKSRADLWQLAALIALEMTLERANRACDLDFTARQQVTLLESREACEVKLTAPLKFVTGRADCVPDANDPQGRKYAAAKAEAKPRMFGDADHATDYFKAEFGMGAEHSTALQAIHGAVHVAHIGAKYTWFGGGYLSNMFYKMIANKPTYRFQNGGDMSFGAGTNIWKTAQGDKDGNPVAQTGWRASCMYGWDTPEGGPCFLRPTGARSWDAPNPDMITYDKCVLNVTSDGTCVIDTDQIEHKCDNAWCDENLVEHGVEYDGALATVNGSWYEGVSDASVRHTTGWDNQFAFPWEIGAYWNLTSQDYSETSAQRPVGCSGLDDDFGTINPVETNFSPKWPYKNIGNSNIFNSFAMQCGLNTYSPEGTPMHEIVDKFASDNEYWAEKFLEAWIIMTTNGYTDLTDGPQSAWMGHYSLTKQGLNLGDFDSYIAENSPVTFTDPTVDATICGHKGHFETSCGLTFSKCYELYNTEGMCRGNGMGPGLW